MNVTVLLSILYNTLNAKHLNLIKVARFPLFVPTHLR